MNLVNQQVKHKHFGEGKVVDCSGSYVRVRFPIGEKRFVFPDAFGTYLILVDPETAQSVNELKQQVLGKRKQVRAELLKQKTEEYAERQRQLERERLLRTERFSPASQAVFWLDPEEQEQVFTEWRVFTGVRQSGEHAGKPVRLAKLNNNSACLITHRDEDMAEEDRRIVGMFMVEETFVGKLCDDGYIPAHPKYRLRLSEEEAKQLLFWNYYYDERYPLNTTWNRGRHRYFENLWMAQILQKVMEIKKGTDEEGPAQEFFQYFCKMNHIDPQDIPAPSGALIQRQASAS